MTYVQVYACDIDTIRRRRPICSGCVGSRLCVSIVGWVGLREEHDPIPTAACLPWWFHTSRSVQSFRRRWRHTSGTPTPVSVLVYQRTWCWLPEETPWSRSCRCCRSRTCGTRGHRTCQRCLEGRSWNRPHVVIIVFIIIMHGRRHQYLHRAELSITLSSILPVKERKLSTRFLPLLYHHHRHRHHHQLLCLNQRSWNRPQEIWRAIADHPDSLSAQRTHSIFYTTNYCRLHCAHSWNYVYTCRRETWNVSKWWIFRSAIFTFFSLNFAIVRSSSDSCMILRVCFYAVSTYTAYLQRHKPHCCRSAGVTQSTTGHQLRTIYQFQLQLQLKSCPVGR